MAVYRRVYDSRLTAKNRDQLRDPTLGSGIEYELPFTINKYQTAVNQRWWPIHRCTGVATPLDRRVVSERHNINKNAMRHERDDSMYRSLLGNSAAGWDAAVGPTSRFLLSAVLHQRA